MATTPGIWSEGKLTSKPWNRGSHCEPSWPRFAPTLWMALWPSGHQASIMACILTKHSSEYTQRIMVSEGEINNSAKVMNTCRQQSSVNGIGVVIYTPIWIISNTSFYPCNNYILHFDGYVAWISITTNHGKGIDYDYLRPYMSARRPILLFCITSCRLMQNAIYLLPRSRYFFV